MSVKMHDFQNWAIRLGQKLKRSDDQILNVWLIPDNFNCIRLNNNPHHILAKHDDASDVRPVTRSSKVMFKETYTSRGEYSRYGWATIPAMGNIKGGEELFIDYDDYKLE